MRHLFFFLPPLLKIAELPDCTGLRFQGNSVHSQLPSLMEGLASGEGVDQSVKRYCRHPPLSFTKAQHMEQTLMMRLCVCFPPVKMTLAMRALYLRRTAP